MAETVSKAVWIQGEFQAVWGYAEVVTSKHDVAQQTIVSSGLALDTMLTAMATPQPAHMVCPDSRSRAINNLMGLMVFKGYRQNSTIGDIAEASMGK
jgi:hypothetical protein